MRNENSHNPQQKYGYSSGVFLLNVLTLRIQFVKTSLDVLSTKKKEY